MPVEKRPLSGSTNGRNIKVAATATAGTTIHTVRTGTTDGNYDLVTLYAANTSTSAVKLTIEAGGTTSPDDLIEVTIPGEAGGFLIFDKRLFNNAVVVRAFAGTANVINIWGDVDKVDA